MIRTHTTSSLPIPLVVAISGGLVAILVNQKLYAKIRPDLRDAVWNQAFADTEALVRNGHRDDLALRRQARQAVEDQMADCAAAPTACHAVPRLSIAGASNIIPNG